MEKFNRAVRRHHKARLKREAEKRQTTHPASLILMWMRKDFLGERGWYTPCPRHVGVVIDTPQPCSCFACHNPRWRDGKTWKERSFIELARKLQEVVDDSE